MRDSIIVVVTLPGACDVHSDSGRQTHSRSRCSARRPCRSSCPPAARYSGATSSCTASPRRRARRRRSHESEYGFYVRVGYFPAGARAAYAARAGIDERHDRLLSYAEGRAPRLWPSLDPVHFYPKRWQVAAASHWHGPPAVVAAGTAGTTGTAGNARRSAASTRGHAASRETHGPTPATPAGSDLRLARDARAPSRVRQHDRAPRRRARAAARARTAR
jgi:hypothetical protein